MVGSQRVCAFFRTAKLQQIVVSKTTRITTEEGLISRVLTSGVIVAAVISMISAGSSVTSLIYFLMKVMDFSLEKLPAALWDGSESLYINTGCAILFAGLNSPPQERHVYFGSSQSLILQIADHV